MAREYPIQPPSISLRVYPRLPEMTRGDPRCGHQVERSDAYQFAELYRSLGFQPRCVGFVWFCVALAACVAAVAGHTICVGEGGGGKGSNGPPCIGCLPWWRLAPPRCGISPHISPYLPASPRSNRPLEANDLPISPRISPHFPTSAQIAPALFRCEHMFTYWCIQTTGSHRRWRCCSAR